MTKTNESYFKTFDGTEIFIKQRHVEASQGLVLITHGLGEHSGSYDHLADSLNQEQWSVLTWDLRGHGKSSGQRGYIPHFDDFISDFEKLYETLEHLQWIDKDKPLILFAHSMGGTILLKFLLTKRAAAAAPHMSAACLSAPALGLIKRPSTLTLWVARLIKRLNLKITLNNPIIYEELTNDENQIKIYEMDTLRHTRISPNIYLGMIDAYNYVHQHAANLKSPLLFQIPENDPIVDSQSTLKLSQKLNPKKCQVKTYSNSRHEIFNGLEKKQALNDLKKFINSLSIKNNET